MVFLVMNIFMYIPPHLNLKGSIFFIGKVAKKKCMNMYKLMQHVVSKYQCSQRSNNLRKYNVYFLGIWFNFVLESSGHSVLQDQFSLNQIPSVGGI